VIFFNWAAISRKPKEGLFLLSKRHMENVVSKGSSPFSRFPPPPWAYSYYKLLLLQMFLYKIHNEERIYLTHIF
jgi:hypothetical protein